MTALGHDLAVGAWDGADALDHLHRRDRAVHLPREEAFTYREFKLPWREARPWESECVIG